MLPSSARASATSAALPSAAFAGAVNSNSGATARLFAGRRERISLALFTAAASSLASTETPPSFAASAPFFPSPAVRYTALSSVATTKSEDAAIRAALPTQVPAITAIWGTTPERLFVYARISL